MANLCNGEVVLVTVILDSGVCCVEILHDVSCMGVELGVSCVELQVMAGGVA